MTVAFPRRAENGELSMLGYNRWQLFKGLAAVVVVMSVVSLLLIYFIPSAPSKVIMATAFKGSAFGYFGQQYRKIFARSHVELELRETAGAVENVELLQDPKSGVQIAFVLGGVSDEEHAPGLLSLGTVYNNPFWIFNSSNEQRAALAAKRKAHCGRADRERNASFRRTNTWQGGCEF